MGNYRQLRLAAISIGIILSLLAGCGSDGDAEPDAARTALNGDVFNDADVEFATAMIPHHAQALAMVDLTVGRKLSPEVELLAATIRETQAPEVEQMTDWLTAWDEPVPETSLDHANAHGDGDAPDTEIDELEAATDSEFEQKFLEMMIEHHKDAVEMAETEQVEGEYPDGLALAASIEASQNREIETMEGLLG